MSKQYRRFDKSQNMGDGSFALLCKDDTKLNELLAEAKIIDEENAEVYKSMLALFDELYKFHVDSCHPWDVRKTSTAVRKAIPKPAGSYVAAINGRVERMKQNEKRAEEESAKKAEEQAKDKEVLRKHAAAIKYLEARGYVVDVTSSPIKITKDDEASGYSDPVQLANSIEFDEYIAARVKENEETGELFSFCGDDYCEDCGGWDGSSRRCECGNRRVSWERDGDFEDMHVYAEAY